MKPIQVMTVLLGALFAGQTALAEAIQLSAVKKTADTRKSSAQQLPRGSTQLSMKSQFYRIDFRPMSPNLPEQANLEYVVLQENFDGQLEESVRGEKGVDLTFGKSQSFESDTFELDERQWQGRKVGAGSVKQDVYGVGIRIVDSGGEVLAEKYIPASKKKELEEALNRKPEEKAWQKSQAGEMLRERMKKKRLQQQLRKP